MILLRAELKSRYFFISINKMEIFTQIYLFEILEKKIKCNKYLQSIQTNENYIHLPYKNVLEKRQVNFCFQKLLIN